MVIKGKLENGIFSENNFILKLFSVIKSLFLIVKKSITTTFIRV